MSLPTIDYPVYETKLPSNGDTVKFRPFLVKEKKLLMMASEENTFDSMYNAAKQIITNCTMSKLKTESLPLFDIQHLFLKIRAKSIGEVTDFTILCEKCQKPVPLSINLDEVVIQKDPKHSKRIMLNKTVGLEMKYPDLTTEKFLQAEAPEAQQEIDLIINSIDCVFDENQKYYAKDTPRAELKELVEGLTQDNYEKIKQFFETIPKFNHKVKYHCNSCNNDGELTINNLTDFFG